MKIEEQPIALEAYEKLAESYAARIDTKAENAYCERPATLSLLPDVKGMRVLDAGCGPGLYAEWLLDHGAEVIAVDVSPKMVRFARERVGNRAEVRLRNLTAPLDFLDSESVDLVLSSLVMDYIKNWEPVFAEFHRILRKRGIFVFSTGHPLIEHILRNRENYFAVELTELTWRGFGIPVNVPSYRRPLGAMVSALADAGFVVERMVEPRPTEEFKKADPEGHKRLSKVPGFLCIRARKDERMIDH